MKARAHKLFFITLITFSFNLCISVDIYAKKRKPESSSLNMLAEQAWLEGQSGYCRYCGNGSTESIARTTPYKSAGHLQRHEETCFCNPDYVATLKNSPLPLLNVGRSPSSSSASELDSKHTPPQTRAEANALMIQGFFRETINQIADNKNQLSAEDSIEQLSAKIKILLSPDKNSIRQKLIEEFSNRLQHCPQTVIDTYKEILDASIKKLALKGQIVQACQTLFKQYLTTQELQFLFNKISLQRKSDVRH